MASKTLRVSDIKPVLRRTEEVVEQGFTLKERIIHGAIAVDEYRATKEATFFEGAVRSNATHNKP